VSGHRPFGTGNFAETISAVLTADPPPFASHGLAAPAGIERVIGRCLQKNRDQRYQTMREVRLELESVRRTLQSGETLSSSREEPLSSSRSTAGSTPPGGSRVTRRAVLVTTVGAIVVAAAAYAWLKNPSPHGAARSAQAISSPAYDLYLRGKVNVGSENRDNNDTAIKLLTQAVAADPEFAPAYAQLARAYHIKAFYYAPDAERTQLTEDAAVAVEKALRLDPNLAEGYLARGLLIWSHGNRFPHESAAKSFRRAIALNPLLDEAHHQLALVYLHVGLLDKAWGQIDEALAANPANMMARFRYGVIDMYRGRYDKALEIFTSTPLKSNPGLLTFQQASALFQLGKIPEATSLVDEYLRTQSSDEGGNVTSVKAMLLAKAGNVAEAQQAIDRAIAVGQTFGHFHHTAYNIASAYALLGKPDEALQWLRTAADDGFPCYPLFAQDANLNSLRTDARFVAFLADMKARMERYDSTL
jgi:tetratricopeptide (TPR) repeat protein